MKIRLLALLLALVLAGCVTATAGITTSNIPLEGRKFTVLGPAETTVTWWSLEVAGLVGFPLRKPPVDEALQDLLKQKGGDALVNIRYSTDNIVVFFFFNMHRFHVKADVVKLESK